MHTHTCARRRDVCMGAPLAALSGAYPSVTPMSERRFAIMHWMVMFDIGKPMPSAIVTSTPLTVAGVQSCTGEFGLKPRFAIKAYELIWRDVPSSNTGKSSWLSCPSTVIVVVSTSTEGAKGGAGGVGGIGGVIGCSTLMVNCGCVRSGVCGGSSGGEAGGMGGCGESSVSEGGGMGARGGSGGEGLGGVGGLGDGSGTGCTARGLGGNGCGSSGDGDGGGRLGKGGG